MPEVQGERCDGSPAPPTSVSEHSNSAGAGMNSRTWSISTGTGESCSTLDHFWQIFPRSYSSASESPAVSRLCKSSMSALSSSDLICSACRYIARQTCSLSDDSDERSEQPEASRTRATIDAWKMLLLFIGPRFLQVALERWHPRRSRDPGSSLSSPLEPSGPILRRAFQPALELSKCVLGQQSLEVRFGRHPIQHRIKIAGAGDKCVFQAIREPLLA